MAFNSAVPVLIAKKGSGGCGVFGPSGYDFSCDSTYMSYYEPGARGVMNFVKDFIHAPSETVREWKSQHSRWVNYERDHRDQVEYLNGIIESWFEQNVLLTPTEDIANMMQSYAENVSDRTIESFCRNHSIPNDPVSLQALYSYDASTNRGWPTMYGEEVRNWIQVGLEDGVLTLYGDGWYAELVDFEGCGYEFSSDDIAYMKDMLDDIFTVMMFEMLTNEEQCPQE